MALASIIRWRANEVLAVPVSWYPPDLASEEEARVHASAAAIAMIDAGRVKI